MDRGHAVSLSSVVAKFAEKGFKPDDRVESLASRTLDLALGALLAEKLREVAEDDEQLAWFPGDQICSACLADGAWG